MLLLLINVFLLSRLPLKIHLNIVILCLASLQLSLIIRRDVLDFSLQSGNILSQFLLCLHLNHYLVELGHLDRCWQVVFLGVEFLIFELEDAQGAVIAGWE